MRHPFDGVNASAATDGPGMTRRAVLGYMAAGAAGVLGLATATPGQITTAPGGEEGGPVTAARLEAGGTASVPTTEPFGEEAGHVVSRALPGLEDGSRSDAVRTDALGEGGATPVATTLALGEEGGRRMTSRGFGEEGGLTKRRGEDAGYTMSAPIVPVAADSTDLEERQLELAWEGLGDKDAAHGVQSCAVLFGDKKAVPFLKKKLTAESLTVGEIEDRVISRLIDDLDSDEFTVRERASAELGKVATMILPRLEKALKEASGSDKRLGEGSAGKPGEGPREGMAHPDRQGSAAAGEVTSETPRGVVGRPRPNNAHLP